MADPFLDEFDKEFGAAKPKKASSGDPNVDAWSKAFDRTFAAGKAVGKAGVKAGAKLGEEALGKAVEFFGSVLSTPKAAVIKAVSGNKTPVEFSPTASLRQLEELSKRLDVDRLRMAHPWSKPILDPGTADLVTDLAAAPALNAVGKNVVLPAGRALANAEIGGFRTRALPGVRGTLDFLKPGASLPNKYRDEFYRTLAEAEGKTDWRAYLRRKALESGQSLSREAQDAITHAIETHTVGSLPDDLQAYAKRVITENRNMIADRLRAGMSRAELEGGQGYVARILTPEGRKGVQVPAEGGGLRPLSPYGEAFDQGAPGLGTDLGKLRTEAGRKLTTAEMDPTRTKFLPSIEGTLAKGAQNDKAVMHAKIIRDLDRKFGKNLMPGEQPIGSIRGIPAGFDDETKKYLMKRSLPPELHEVVSRLNQTFAPEEWGKKSEYIRQVNDFFRKTALFSPGFLSRNMQNNIIQTAIFGNANPLDIGKTWKPAYDLRWKMFRGQRLTPAETADLKEMIENGILSRGYIAKETGGGKFDAAFRGMRRLNTAAEDVSRMSFYKYLREKGMAPYEAGQRVNQVLFNYSPTFQSRGFKAVRRHVMPFINWQTNIPQLAVRTAVERPGSLGVVGTIRARLNEHNATPEAYKKLPDYMRNELATAIAKDTWLMPQGFGTSDVGGQMSAVGEDAQALGPVAENLAKGGQLKLPPYRDLLHQNSAIAGQLASMSYPQWSLLYSSVTGKDPFTGNQITDWRKYLAGKVPALRIPTLAKEIYEKKPGWQGRVLSFIAGVKTYEKPTQ